MDTNPDKSCNTGEAEDASHPLTQADIPEFVKAVTEVMIAKAQHKSTEVKDPGKSTLAGASECSGTEWRVQESWPSPRQHASFFSRLCQ